ncbi:hypothetical protein CSB11_02550 [Candidatus Campbellbacteria bacterium]|nr:MAG: hypothetical protein CSB11_02550 [Candidatus Campbellbacteria bacterium]
MCEVDNFFKQINQNPKTPFYEGIEFLETSDLVNHPNYLKHKNNLFLGLTFGDIGHIAYHPNGSMEAQKIVPKINIQESIYL